MENFNYVPMGANGFKLMELLWKLGEKIVSKLSGTKKIGTVKSAADASKKTSAKVFNSDAVRDIAAVAALTAAGTATALAPATNPNDSTETSRPWWVTPAELAGAYVGSRLLKGGYRKFLGDTRMGEYTGMRGMDWPAFANNKLVLRSGIIPDADLSLFRWEFPTWQRWLMKRKAVNGRERYADLLGDFNAAAGVTIDAENALTLQSILDNVNAKIADYLNEYERLTNLPEGSALTDAGKDFLRKYKAISQFPDVKAYSDALYDAAYGNIDAATKKAIDVANGVNNVAVVRLPKVRNTALAGVYWRNAMRLLPWAFGLGTLGSVGNYFYDQFFGDHIPSNNDEQQATIASPNDTILLGNGLYMIGDTLYIPLDIIDNIISNNSYNDEFDQILINLNNDSISE